MKATFRKLTRHSQEMRTLGGGECVCKWKEE